MIKTIKKIFLGLLLFMMMAGLLKDKFVDTPESVVERLSDSFEQFAWDSPQTSVVNVEKTLMYKMYFWSIIPMGTLQYVTKDDPADFIFSLTASSEGSLVQYFTKAMIQVVSHFNKKTLMPHSYVEQTRVQGKEKTKKIDFDHHRLVVIRDGIKIKIPKQTYDPVGAFVYALTLPYETAKVHRIKFIVKEEIYVLTAQLVEHRNGIYKILMEARREDRSSSHGAKFYVWLTADNARIPLVFKSFSAMGYFSVILDKIKPLAVLDVFQDRG